MTVLPQGVHLIPLKIISVDDGDVLHALKKTDPEFDQFGEAYFSTVHKNSIKGWKFHKLMISNLVVPIGEIKFVLYDDRPQSKTINQFFSINLSINNYQRLVIPPKIWLAFQGIRDETNLLLNIADIPHDPDEADHRDLNLIPYPW